ncbi:hypothetical protein [Vibrio sp. A1-1]|uniref:hypothetical protein n=1 Tax=Vibrio sp. A1-1 TaxID=2912250 RepID=UPI001F2186DB|nr:hypothetical protein [Vibrio sp. A1-1]EHU0358677.1 hypothetical protein [Vibrio parahaemolyticus]MCF7455917.1 hypothetical protein [Vibrio sp. A1-1]HCG6024079.1 hypothetical protein [Vibrio parahaemolyticus]HCH2721432.1 hypothetical protein [Vibrio parahaemolyticus]
MTIIRKQIEWKQEIQPTCRDPYTHYFAVYESVLVVGGVRLNFRMQTGMMHYIENEYSPSNEIEVDVNYENGVHQILEMALLNSNDPDDLKSLSMRYGISLTEKKLGEIRREFSRLQRQIERDWEAEYNQLLKDDSHIKSLGNIK